DLGPFNLPVAMLVATVKATLVASVFMHLWFDSKLNLVVFVVTLLFLAIFITLTAFDLLTRDSVDPTKANYRPRDEKVQQYLEKNPEGGALRPRLKDPADAALKDKLIPQDAAH
ncbi:MAG: cytochrome C oxidase subunit IV family protein, partial [Myxococcota bacterium]